MLLPTLAKAKKKANRLKCASQGSAKAQFLGPSDGPAQNRMSGLDSGTGNFATSDGSVKQAYQAQFDSQITATSKVAGGNIIEPNQSINRFYGR